MKELRMTHQVRLVFRMAFLIIAGFSSMVQPEVVSYPAIDSLQQSDVYTVHVNGQAIWTEKYRTNFDFTKLPDWFISELYTKVQQEVHIANFSCSGILTVQISLNQPVEKASIHPASRRIVPQIHGQEIEFTLPGPDKLYIKVNDLPPLCFFANPLETEIPTPDDPTVTYFAPGVHRPGMMKLKDDATVYIAGGAIVYGGIETMDVKNIRVYGRGILDGNFEYPRMVKPVNSTKIEFNGIIIRCGGGWTNTLVNCNQVKYQDVKVISFCPGGDGINPLGSRNVTIDHCFLRCTDDCIAIKAPAATHVVDHVRITNNTMIGYAFSDGVTIGFETNGPRVTDVLVKNCDILQARGGSRVDGHSAFSIICDGPAVISNIRYEDIRVEADVLKLFELNITDGSKYGIDPPGHIENVHLANISWEAPKPILLKGFDSGHMVRNVVFEKCVINGEPVTSARKDIFSINEFVEGVTFK
jgi:hypothetical protein